MPTQREYWSGKFKECPNCGNTNEGDIIYKCEETFLGGIADDISAALGEEITHCGKVFCEECGTILHYCPNPDCNGLGSMIGKIKSNSADDDESSDDESDSDDDSSDDVDYSSFSSDSSDDDSPVIYTSRLPNNNNNNSQNDIALIQASLFNLIIILPLVFGIIFLDNAYKKSKEAALVEQNKSAVSEPGLEVGGSGIDDGISGQSGGGSSATSIGSSQDLPATSNIMPPQIESERPPDDAANPTLTNKDDFFDNLVDPEFGRKKAVAKKPAVINNNDGVVENILLYTVSTTGQRLPGTEVLVRFNDGHTQALFLSQDSTIQIGDQVHVIYSGDN